VNHLTNNLDEELNYLFRDKEEEPPVCFYCLEEIQNEIVFKMVNDRTITMCKACYSFQNENK
jgi:hypothetical protein